ncbi:YadA C-terminal domain-containing protein [uncultured Veillonella sp.]|uniref:YadA C-terminal domain-containing protein n=1 Tax=uncultured Veillonella sp. TaxID=159268 RepID=UPI00262486A4|nr:YadA-like family protein [uncultured Veillonella sp.]
MKQSKKRMLKSLVMSTLMVASVATAVQAQAVTLGDTAKAHDGAVAIGNNVVAEKVDAANPAEIGSIAIGNDAVAKNDGIAIGNNVYTGRKDETYDNLRPENISIGNRVQAAIGATNHGIGIGSDVVHGLSSVGIGTNVNAQTMDSIVIGHNASAKLGKEGIAIGLNATTALQSIALGTDTKANSKSIAIGLSSIADQVADGVALGSKSIANRNGLIFEGTPEVTTSETPVLGELVPYHPKKVSTPVTTEVYASSKASKDDKASIVSTVKGSLSAVSVGNDDETRQIVHVAAGSADTDAVNVAQLKSVDNRLTVVDGQVVELTGRVDTIENQINDIKTSGSTNTTEINNIKEIVNNQKDTIEQHDREIKDLGDRVSDNTKSINDLDGRVTNNTNAISDLNDRFDSQSNAISGLNTRVDRLGKEVNKVGAGAAALAGLHPLDFDDDSKLTFAAGFGSYKNEQAAAVGAFYRPNENLMFSFGTAVGNSDNMYNAGLSVRFGQSSPYEGLSKAELVSELEKQGQDIDALKAKASEVDTVKAENAALNERLAKLEALITNR